jgi:hypothetical protein
MFALLHGLIGLTFLPLALLFATIASKLPPTQRVGITAMGIGMTLFMPIILCGGGVSGGRDRWLAL